MRIERRFGEAKGQTLHSSMSFDRWDDECDGVIRAAYVRQLIDGRQKWVRVGEHCDGCGSFWPGARRESVRSIDRRRAEMNKRHAAPEPAANAEYPVIPKAVTGRPSRNDRCPCGSGRKYKRCHGSWSTWRPSNSRPEDRNCPLPVTSPWRVGGAARSGSGTSRTREQGW